MTNDPRRLDVVPAIDLLGGQTVRLFQGDYAQVTEYTANAAELAAHYASAGARRLHVVDLDGARSGDPINLPIIRSLTGLGMEVQTGGGIRDLSRLQALLKAGVSRAVIGSIAVKSPDTVASWLAEVGPERIVLALDVRIDPDSGQPEPATDGWTEGSGQSLWTLVDYFLEAGAREFLCTDIARDGTLGGPNLALYAECVRRFPQAEFTASGGVSGLADLEALRATGVARVVTGKALLDGRLTLKELEQFSRDA